MFRKILLPFSILYTIVLRIRHFLYDNSIIKSKKFDIPVIAIGNLSLGGTGKTPHTIYIAERLKKSFKVGVLSRG
jgi:tetraacyldisaccharide 4'-kinase